MDALARILREMDRADFVGAQKADELRKALRELAQAWEVNASLLTQTCDGDEYELGVAFGMKESAFGLRLAMVRSLRVAGVSE